MSEFSRSTYEHLLYTLPQQYSEVASWSLHLFTRSATVGLVKESVQFHNGGELRMRELVALPHGEILDYSYDVLRDGEVIRWYDPQPHLGNPDLASTYPHHLHTPPDIKRNRKPAPGFRFAAPSLPSLIRDCIALGERGRD